MGERVSDLVNLTRAKDAAIAWSRSRGLGGGETVTWHHRETAPAAAIHAISKGGPCPAPATAETYQGGVGRQGPWCPNWTPRPAGGSRHERNCNYDCISGEQSDPAGSTVVCLACGALGRARHSRSRAKGLGSMAVNGRTHRTDPPARGFVGYKGPRQGTNESPAVTVALPA
jgi:hypothetical protein